MMTARITSRYLMIGTLCFLGLTLFGKLPASAIDGVCVMFCDTPAPPTPSYESSSPSEGGLYSAPDGQGWFCEARAKDGSWGWGESSSKSRAQTIALNGCSEHANGCSIRTCALNAGRDYDHVNGRWHKKPNVQPASTSPIQQPKIKSGAVKKPLYSCSVCGQKLYRDATAGLGSASLRTYIQQTVAGYRNCKRKADNQCPADDNRLAFNLQTQCLIYFGDSYRECIDKVLAKY